MAHGVQPTDPFKLLLYKILGRCELHLKSLHGVITTIEDYTWLQLTLVRETVQEERSDLETYRLRDFQKIISDQQPEHFSENKLNPWFYFNVLLLSLQLEKVRTSGVAFFFFH
jgi:nuclear pore complex protein Nup93